MLRIRRNARAYGRAAAIDPSGSTLDCLSRQCSSDELIGPVTAGPKRPVEFGYLLMVLSSCQTLSGMCENLRPGSTYSAFCTVVTRPLRRLTASSAKGGSTSHCNIGRRPIPDIVGIDGAYVHAPSRYTLRHSD